MKKLYYLLLFLYVLAATFTIIFFNGTGDEGDSITHYLFAKYAFKHQDLFFDHWAKPVFVLLSSPFAQFGFTGIKIFNSLVTLFNLILTYKVSELLKLNNNLLVIIFLMFAPLNFILTFSGLTEPLFALFIILSIYLILIKRNLFASLILSFIPFVRTEGLIILIIFAIYFYINKQRKIIPLLLTGHIIYSITGFFYHNDLLWVFNKIPYANTISPYGSGNLFHFVEKLTYVIGIPIYILFVAGFVKINLEIYRKKYNIEITFLILIIFLSFFIAHSIFWYLGIFNSMGLQRVLLSVMPIIAIISLYGFNFITEIFSRYPQINKYIKIVIILYVIIFPFTSNPAAINWNRDMKLSKTQQLAIETIRKININLNNKQRIIISLPYISEILNMDYFDNNKIQDLNSYNLKKLQKDDIVIWVNWYAEIECKIKKTDLKKINRLENIFNIHASDKGKEIEFAVYKFL